jgi:hypothetical protein
MLVAGTGGRAAERSSDHDFSSLWSSLDIAFTFSIINIRRQRYFRSKKIVLGL